MARRRWTRVITTRSVKVRRGRRPAPAVRMRARVRRRCNRSSRAAAQTGWSSIRSRPRWLRLRPVKAQWAKAARMALIDTIKTSARPSMSRSSRHADRLYCAPGRKPRDGERRLAQELPSFQFRHVREQLAREFPAMVLPPITISCSHEHAAWRGTVSISARTLHQVVTDIYASLAASGIHRLVLISGHGGNYVLANVAQEASVDGPRIAVFPQWP